MRIHSWLLRRAHNGSNRWTRNLLRPLEWLSAQFLGAAHVYIPGFVKAPKPMYVARNADSQTLADRASEILVSMPWFQKQTAIDAASFPGMRVQLRHRLDKLPFRQCVRLTCRTQCHGPKLCQSDSVPTSPYPEEVPFGVDAAVGNRSAFDLRASRRNFTVRCGICDS